MAKKTTTLFKTQHFYQTEGERYPGENDPESGDINPVSGDIDPESGDIDPGSEGREDWLKSRSAQGKPGELARLHRHEF